MIARNQYLIMSHLLVVITHTDGSGEEMFKLKYVQFSIKELNIHLKCIYCLCLHENCWNTTFWEKVNQKLPFVNIQNHL